MILLLVAAAVAAPLAEYRAAIADVREGKGSVETAYRAARTLREAALEVIEDMPTPEYEALERDAEGMIINNVEVMLAEPDVSFFLALARKHGNAADVAFFETLAATYPDSLWAVYVMQETDVTGCLVPAELEPARARWLAFRAKHPDAYRDAVQRELEAIDEVAGRRPCD